MNNEKTTMWPWIIGAVVLLIVVLVGWNMIQAPIEPPVEETPVVNPEPQVQATPPVVAPEQDLSTTTDEVK